MSFEWYNRIEKIKNILEEIGYVSFKNEIMDRQVAGSTFSEILLGVCSKLIDIKLRDQMAYDMIRADAEELIAFCISVGLTPLT